MKNKKKKKTAIKKKKSYRNKQNKNFRFFSIIFARCIVLKKKMFWFGPILFVSRLKPVITLQIKDHQITETTMMTTTTTT
jgi:hypothetical protein